MEMAVISPINATVEETAEDLLQRKVAALDDENRRLALELIDAKAEANKYHRRAEHYERECESLNQTLSKYHELHAKGYARNIRAQRVDNAERGHRFATNVVMASAGLALGLVACFVALVLCL